MLCLLAFGGWQLDPCTALASGRELTWGVAMSLSPLSGLCRRSRMWRRLGLACRPARQRRGTGLRCAWSVRGLNRRLPGRRTRERAVLNLFDTHGLVIRFSRPLHESISQANCACREVVQVVFVIVHAAQVRRQCSALLRAREHRLSQHRCQSDLVVYVGIGYRDVCDYDTSLCDAAPDVVVQVTDTRHLITPDGLEPRSLDAGYEHSVVDVTGPRLSEGHDNERFRVVDPDVDLVGRLLRHQVVPEERARRLREVPLPIRPVDNAVIPQGDPRVVLAVHARASQFGFGEDRVGPVLTPVGLAEQQVDHLPFLVRAHFFASSRLECPRLVTSLLARTQSPLARTLPQSPGGGATLSRSSSSQRRYRNVRRTGPISISFGAPCEPAQRVANTSTLRLGRASPAVADTGPSRQVADH